MNVVINHIKELLYTNDCVIIPEFGGFVTSYQVSEVHPIKHHFTPPSKRVAFNEKLKLNDGLLVMEIANSSKISIEEATNLITDFVNEVKSTLKKSEKFLIEGIGSFIKNAEGRLQFKNEVKENYLEDSFGLPDFFAEPISRENNIKLRNKFKDRKAMSSEEVKKEQKETKKKKGGAGIWVLSIIAILLCISAVTLFVMDKGENSMLSSIFPTGNTNEVMESTDSDSTEMMEEEIVDSTYSEEEEMYDEEYAEEETTTEISDEKNVDEEAVEENNVSESSGEIFLNELTGRYYVICGAFGEQSNAETLRDELIGKGYDAKVLSPLGRKPLFRVSIADYDTQEEGLEKSSTENESFENSLWVMKY